MWCRISKVQELYRARPTSYPIPGRPLLLPEAPSVSGFWNIFPEWSASAPVVVFIIVITIISIVIYKGLGRMPRTF